MKIGFDYIGISTNFACFNERGKLLMHRRGDACRDEQGTWDVGGGKLEFDLTLKENVIKEIKEEYGCEAVIVDSLPPIDIIRQFDGFKNHWVSCPFIVSVKSEAVIIGEPDKMSEIGWFDLDNLPQPLHSGFKQVLDKYLQEYKKYAKQIYDAL